MCRLLLMPFRWGFGCRVMFKVGNLYYGLARLEDSAQAMEFELSR